MVHEEGKVIARRRRINPKFKVRVVLELISDTQAEVRREYSLDPQMVATWKTEFVEKTSELFRTKEHRSAEQVRIAELERTVVRLSLTLKC